MQFNVDLKEHLHDAALAGLQPLIDAVAGVLGVHAKLHAVDNAVQSASTTGETKQQLDSHMAAIASSVAQLEQLARDAHAARITTAQVHSVAAAVQTCKQHLAGLQDAAGGASLDTS